MGDFKMHPRKMPTRILVNMQKIMSNVYEKRLISPKNVIFQFR